MSIDSINKSLKEIKLILKRIQQLNAQLASDKPSEQKIIHSLH